MTEKKEFANRLNTGCQRKTGVQDYMKNLARTTRRAKVTLLKCIPGPRRSPGGGHGNPLQYSCLENPTDRGVLWATVHRVTESDTTEET